MTDGPVVHIPGMAPFGEVTAWEYPGSPGSPGPQTFTVDYGPRRNRVIYARILWDGVHGEVFEVKVTNRTYRKVHKAVRHRERFPHLYRQHYPKRFGY